MARLYPPSFPHDLKKHPKRAGEHAVYEALRDALDDAWFVFYDRRVPGSNRPIDFLVIHPERHVLALEVKGGQVHAVRGRFRQMVSRTGQRIVTTPFAQTRKALIALCRAIGIEPDTLPVHIAAFFPMMAASAFPWADTGPHIMTREHLDSQVLATAIMRTLPTPPITQAVYVHALLRALKPA